jgi:hypothetical protein
MANIDYTFKIDAFTPETLPLKRLAEYLSQLATLYGSQERVHFVRLKKSSAILINRVEFESAPKVKERLDGVKHRDAPNEAIDAYSRLDNMLAEDNATGVIALAQPKRKAAIILEFPGRNRESIENFGAVTQTGSLDGQLIRIGGFDETVPVLLLEEDRRRYCTCNRETARLLAPYLFGQELRVFGNGRWQRDAFGNWAMERFSISNFQPLNETGLSEVTANLRSIESDLQKFDDPLGELRRLRHGQE